MPTLLSVIFTLPSNILVPPNIFDKSVNFCNFQRHVPIEIKELGDKVSILNICHKNIVPRPQRVYRTNRRGKMMTQQQVKLYGERSSNLTALNINNFM